MEATSFSLTAILGIPAAVKASLDVIDRLASRAGGQEKAELEHARANVKGILTNLHQFTDFSQELLGWKTIHDITNQLQVLLNEPLAAAKAPDPDEFQRACTEAAIRSSYISVFERLTPQQGPLARLRDFSARYENYRLEAAPAWILELCPDERWDRRLTRLLELPPVQLRARKYESAHETIITLDSLITAVNNLADFRIRDRVDFYTQEMSKLRDLLRPEIGR
jgi:hypothetical protein